MSSISVHHHYLPVSFIKGFIYPAQKVWLFDKRKDKIIKAQQYPKSIFFEKDRNNIQLHPNLKTDLIETRIYKRLEDRIVAQIKSIQTDKLDTIESSQYIHPLIFMIALTFYRTPAAREWVKKNFEDFDINKFPDHYKKLFERVNSLEICKVDKQKLISSFSVFLNFYSTDKIGGKQNYKFVDLQSPSFILSDNPVLYETLPKDYNDLTSFLIFPVTEKRVYFGLKTSGYNIDDKIIKQINIFLALQAERYFASTDKIFLEQIANAYRIIKPLKKYIDEMKAELFKMINDVG